jgi:hypothetical protein
MIIELRKKETFIDKENKKKIQSKNFKCTEIAKYEGGLKKSFLSGER